MMMINKRTSRHERVGAEATHKRRRTTGRYRVRTKTEVMVESLNTKVTRLRRILTARMFKTGRNLRAQWKPKYNQSVDKCVSLDVAGQITFETTEVPDLVLLHATLEHDGAVPNGYLELFLSLEHHLYAAAGRLDRRSAHISNAAAGQWLHTFKQKKEDELREERTAVDQLISASEPKPRRFRTRYQAVETTERNKWLDALADLLLSSSTPMGVLLREDPTNRRLLGAGRRAGTIRARVRAIRKLLAMAHELPYPTSYMHMVEFLQVQHSEPCVRGAIRLTHAAFVFMEELSGVPERFSSNPLYVSIKKELMATSQGSRESKQAPSFPVVVLAALEELLSDISKPLLIRIMARWLLLQSWGTLRFADH